MSQSIFALSKHPTPVFNTSDIPGCFGNTDGNSLSLNENGLMKSVETVLWPQSRVEILERVAQSKIWHIRTEEYPYDGPYYIDERFLEEKKMPNFPAREKRLPSSSVILDKLKSLLGARYIWGGNWPEGIELLPELYPSKNPLATLDPLLQDTWKLKGLDCTGLLYYATDGWTMRNSSSHVKFGQTIPIENRTIEQIMEKLKPLDTIAWVGHIVCVFNPTTTIESKFPEGVITTGLYARLKKIMSQRRPVDNWDTSNDPRFVIRRWHPDFLV